MLEKRVILYTVSLRFVRYFFYVSDVQIEARQTYACSQRVFWK